MTGAIENLSLDFALPGLAVRDSCSALARAVADRAFEIACGLTSAVVAGWWRGLTDALGVTLTMPACDARQGALTPDLAARAAAIGADLAAQPIRTAAAQIGHLYCSLLSPAHRSANGVFYTPPLLVERLLDQAEAAGHDWTVGRVIDPSCGAGAFLIEAASRMTLALGAADPAFVIAAIGARLRGWDIDPFAAWLAQVSVEALLLPQVVASGRRLPLITEARNSLAGWAGHDGQYALVMNNPAFGKLKDSIATRNRFGRSLYGHPNLYGLFMDLAVHLAAPDRGLVAYLTPASYLGGHYFKALRRLLVREAPPVNIDIVESRTGVFEGVLQEVALSVFQRGSRRRTATCSVLHVEPDGLRIEPGGKLALPKDEEDAWLMPRTAADAPFVRRMRDMPTRLSDWGYTVSTGPLVWNRKKDRLHNDPRPGSVPVIWAEAVSIQGVFRLKPSRQSHAAFYTPSGPTDPNLVRVACLLVQRTTSKEQSRRLISALLPADVITAHESVTVENHLNMIVPVRPNPAVPIETVATFFASATADRIIRCINASVAVSATELEAMPLPKPHEIVEAMESPDPDAALRRLYGIPG